MFGTIPFENSKAPLKQDTWVWWGCVRGQAAGSGVGIVNNEGRVSMGCRIPKLDAYEIFQF